MDNSFSGKRVVITGGAGGIGNATAQLMLESHASVTLIDVDADRLDAVSKQLRHLGPLQVHRSDLASFEACSRALDSAEEPIYAVIHLAGIYEHDPFVDDSGLVWDRAIQSNLTNGYNLAKAFDSRVTSNGPGRLVFASSLAFRRGVADHIAYTAAKGGVVGLVRALARHFAPRVLVNAVVPGVIDTPMIAEVLKLRGEKLISDIPLARIGRAEEVARVIRFLCGPDSTYITGQSINIDGGIVAS